MKKSVKKIDVAIVGVQKAATSSLHRYMSQHPEFITHHQFEFAFFVRDQEYNAGYQKGYWNYFDKNDADKKVLIKNVGLIYWEDALKRLAEHNPEIKIILVLRNPVDRAFSAYHYAQLRGYEDQPTFEQALAAHHNRFKDKIRQGAVDYYERGNYFQQIQNLYKYFDKKNINILLHDDLKTGLENTLHECFILSGVDHAFMPNLNVKYNESAKARIPILSQLMVNKNAFKNFVRLIVPNKVAVAVKQKIKDFNRTAYTPPPIDLETRKKLVEYYRPMNEELGKLIGRDVSHWNQ